MVLVPTAGVMVDLESLCAPASEATRTYELALRRELARGRLGLSRDIRPSSSSIDPTDKDEAGRRMGVEVGCIVKLSIRISPVSNVRIESFDISSVSALTGSAEHTIGNSIPRRFSMTCGVDANSRNDELAVCISRKNWMTTCKSDAILVESRFVGPSTGEPCSVNSTGETVISLSLMI